MPRRISTIVMRRAHAAATISFRLREANSAPASDSRRGWFLIGGAERGRTADLLNAIQALSQLSYSPTGGKTFQLIRTSPPSQSNLPPVAMRLADAVQRRDILRDHLAALIVGHSGEIARNHLARVGPRRIRMWEVRGPHQIADPGDIAQQHTDAVILKGGMHLAMKVEARRIRNRPGLEVAIL